MRDRSRHSTIALVRHFAVPSPCQLPSSRGSDESYSHSSSRLECKGGNRLVMDISAVAQRSGVPASTLRFYEDRGLIASVGRRGNKRLFDPGVLDQLALIRLGRTVGFSLDEIARMLTVGGEAVIDRGELAARAAEIDDTITRLTAISSGLKHAAACPAPNHLECPSFRGYLDLAAAGLIGQFPSRQPISKHRSSAGTAVSEPSASS
jgi:DNA-binding transcriptional MerR regulator